MHAAGVAVKLMRDPADGKILRDPESGKLWVGPDAGATCCCDGELPPTLYRQAKRCADDVAINVWAVDADVTEGDDFKTAGGVCAYWSSTTSGTPGTVVDPDTLTPYESCEECLDSTCLDFSACAATSYLVTGVLHTYDGVTNTYTDTPFSEIVYPVPGQDCVYESENGYQLYVADNSGTTFETAEGFECASVVVRSPLYAYLGGSMPVGSYTSPAHGPMQSYLSGVAVS